MDSINVIDQAIKKNNLQIEADDHDLAFLKKNTAFIGIANQSLEYIDEIVLMHLFQKKELKFRIIGRKRKFDSTLLPYLLNVPFNPLAWETYIKKVYDKLTWAKNKGIAICLVLHFTDKSLDMVVQNNFLNRLMKVVLKVQLPIIPIRLKAPFPDFVRPRMGKMLILKKRKSPYKVVVRIGRAISVKDQKKFSKASFFRRFLQSKIFSLGSGLEVKPLFSTNIFKRTEKQEPLAEPIPRELIVNEINAIKDKNTIAKNREYDILVVEAKDIPNTIKEIGRLRELTFREVDEGTGKAFDLDEYDLYYRQLILWDREAELVAGGYRMGLGDEIYHRYGAKGFYISSLFKIKKGFHPTMKAAVELGRSYIIPEYQKKRMPLFLLWKGILYFLLDNPHYRYLYGPVSISKFYSNISRGVIVSFIKTYYFNRQLAKYLKPKKPFKIKVDNVDIELLASMLGDQVKNLDNLIEDIEPDHIKIPVLVRQYLKLNARFISFNVDPNFSDVLDGFIILDLNDVPETMIKALQKEK